MRKAKVFLIMYIYVINMSVESRTIILKTSDILASNNANDYFNTDVSNSNGIIENNRYSFTWHINLREKLGDNFYNKFNRFSIQMKSYGDNPFSTTVIDPTDTSMQYWIRIVQFYLSGLNYDPMPYMNGVSSNSALIRFAGVNSFPSTPGLSVGSTHVADIDCPIYYFTKPSQDTVSLRIDLRLLFNNQMYQPPTSAQIYGHRIFGFNIVGI